MSRECLNYPWLAAEASHFKIVCSEEKPEVGDDSTSRISLLSSQSLSKGPIIYEETMGRALMIMLQIKVKFEPKSL